MTKHEKEQHKTNLKMIEFKAMMTQKMGNTEGEEKKPEHRMSPRGKWKSICN